MDLGEQKEACVTREADWHNLVNPTEPSVCGSDAGLCQITFTTCSLLLLALYACTWCICWLSRDILTQFTSALAILCRNRHKNLITKEKGVICNFGHFYQLKLFVFAIKEMHKNSTKSILVNRFITVKLIARRRVYCIIEACNEGRYGVPVVAVMDFYCGRYWHSMWPLFYELRPLLNWMWRFWIHPFIAPKILTVNRVRPSLVTGSTARCAKRRYFKLLIGRFWGFPQERHVVPMGAKFFAEEWTSPPNFSPIGATIRV